MVSSKKIPIRYSNKLKSMVGIIKNHLKKDPSNKEILRTHKGIEDFCYNYPDSFKRQFMKEVGLKEPKSSKLKKPKNNQIEGFVKALEKLNGECIFLLRDTYEVFNRYNKKTKEGFGVLVNRKFLCDSEEDYFLLIKIFYDSLAVSKNNKDFLKDYLKRFKKLISENKTFNKKAKEVSNYILSHKKSNKLIYVDMGLQFTFCLFCYCSVKINSNNLKQDFLLFSTHPWLQEFFKDKYFTYKNEYVIDLEVDGKEKYYENLKSKSSATLLGFAIGDSLGFPVAGIDKKDISKFLESEISSFQSNSKHPFFPNLKAGQYTDNTSLLILSSKNIIKNKGFKINSYQQDLVSLGNKVLKNKNKERWMGPTALSGITNLIKGRDYRDSGSKTTESCSSTYRVIPLGIFYRNDTKRIKDFSKMSSMVTHNSEISKTGAIITSLIISELIGGISPAKAIEYSINSVKRTKENKILIENIKRALVISKTKPIDYARKLFGTGSPIHQTLPLAIFCFLHDSDNFEKAILNATNSYRSDSEKERGRLKNLSWEKQLQEAKGGNTDGIAGLTGAFLGAHLGIKGIPNKFNKVEDKDTLIYLGKKLILI